MGETTADKMFTLVEVECAGAVCIMITSSVSTLLFLPSMMIIMYSAYNIQEDLTPEATIKILEEIKMGKMPTPGPVSGRKNCEPLSGLTSLTDEPYGPGFGVRSDL